VKFAIRKEYWVPPTIASILLAGVAQYDFLTFHVLAEGAAILIGFMMFAAAWNTTRFTGDYFLLFMGTGYFWVAVIDIVHVLAYPDMNLILPGSANLASQFWLVARFFECGILLAGALIYFRSNHGFLQFAALGVVSVVMIHVVLLGYFPATFVDGVGLTQFKIQSEHVIIVLLGIALYFYGKSPAFKGDRTKSFIVAALLFTIAAEFMFTAYTVFFSQFNMVGHLLKIFSFWMIYQALIAKILVAPHLKIHLLNQSIQQSPLGMSLLDLKGENITKNPAYEKLMKVGTYHLVRGSERIDISKDETWLDTVGVMTALNEGRAWHGTVESQTASPTPRLDAVSISPVMGSSGEMKAALVTISDVTQLVQAKNLVSDQGNAITDVLIGSIAAVADLLETRDPYTSGHSKKVAAMAVELGRELGLGQTELDGLRFAGLIHDIGKIKVPMDILNKPSRLSTAEFEIIKEHPRIGYQVIENIPFPWDVPQIILSHHERWQGQGYPDGLVGDDIPFGARILAVADVIESVTSHRPYRPALGIEKAFDILHEGKGVEFDPAVVDAADKIRDILAACEAETRV